MSGLTIANANRLRVWLDYASETSTTRALMLAIAYDHGVSTTELADRYGLETDAVERTIEDVDSEQTPVAIARLEGVDFNDIAAASNLSVDTVIDWFASLGTSPVSEAASVISRYASQAPGPLLSRTPSTVHYLSHDAVTENGWSVDDDDLFAKANDSNLDLADHGKFQANPEETVLEAAERGGRSWPYACRGGACANCAVLVLDGDVAMPGQSILSERQVRETNARLSCVGVPVTDEVKIIINAQDRDEFQDLLLPSPSGESA